MGHSTRNTRGEEKANLAGVDLPMEKTSPTAVADAIVDALKNGTEDVFPDAMAQQLHQGWKADAKALELQMASFDPQPAQ